MLRTVLALLPDASMQTLDPLSAFMASPYNANSVHIYQQLFAIHTKQTLTL